MYEIETKNEAEIEQVNGALACTSVYAGIFKA